MMKNKKIALLASILVATLVVGVYAGLQLSNIITADWTLEESKTNLVLYWSGGKPSGTLDRGKWISGIYIGLKNVGDADYDNVIGKFEIWTGGAVLPDGCITIQYYVPAGDPYETEGWHDIPLTWDSTKLTGDFGPSVGFPCPVGYDVVTQYRILFGDDAPLTGYGFRAWIEQVP